MRIGVNARLLYSDRLEGIPRYIYETTVRMAQQHPEHRFILFYDRKYTETLTFPPNVQKVIIPLPTRHPVLWFIWFEILLPIWLRWYKIDVFYSGDGYMSLISSVPTVMVSHDLAYLHYPGHLPLTQLWYGRFFYPKFHKKARHIIAVSESTRSDIIDSFGIPASRISVGNNAVPESLMTADHIDQQNVRDRYTGGKAYFIYIGTIHPRKNIPNLIKAFQIFRHRTGLDYRLVLAGRMAWLTDEVEKMITLDPGIIHTGFVDHRVKAELLAGAEAMVYVSLFEGFGIPIIEAMAAGVPVITSNVSSMAEVAGEAALLADPSSPGSVADTMVRLTSEQSLRQSLINAGKIRCRQFDWNTTAELIFEKLMSAHCQN